MPARPRAMSKHEKASVNTEAHPERRGPHAACNAGGVLGCKAVEGFQGALQALTMHDELQLLADSVPAFATSFIFAALPATMVQCC